MMKTKVKKGELEMARIGSELATTRAELSQIEERIDIVLRYGIDNETGMMDRLSARDYDRYREKEARLKARLLELELQAKQHQKKPKYHVPGTRQDDFDEWRVVEQEEKLKEIKASRDSKDQKIERER